MAEPRTFKLTTPHMHGDDVEGWQVTLNRQMKTWAVDYRIDTDGDYGPATRSLASTVLYGLGIAQVKMARGITPELRIKVRNKKLTVAERARYVQRLAWRRKLRASHAGGGYASPVSKILQHSWGYHPGVHDGVDLICPPNAPIAAICDGTVVRVAAGGWWGLGAPSNQAVKAKGDGIIIVRATSGKWKGLNFCYGHAEGGVVHEGQHVKAGQHLGHAGLANAWHVHFMVNNNGDTRGVGDRDPWPYIAYALKHR